MSNPSDVILFKHQLVHDIPRKVPVYAHALEAIRESFIVPPTPTFTKEQVTKALQNLHAHVQDSEAFYVPSTMQAALRGAEEGIPSDFTWHRELVPTANGFLMCEDNYPVEDKNKDKYNLHWISWWCDVDGDGDTVVVLWFTSPKHPLNVLPCYFFSIQDNSQPFSIMVNDWLQPTVKFLAALFTFLQQELVRSEPMEAVRHVRRQLQRQSSSLKSTTLRVVKLQHRTAHRYNDDEHSNIDWQYQWMVRGHWRKQPYRSKGAGYWQWRYIKPYVKGPEDKPLRGGDKVYAVAP